MTQSLELRINGLNDKRLRQYQADMEARRIAPDVIRHAFEGGPRSLDECFRLETLSVAPSGGGWPKAIVIQFVTRRSMTDPTDADAQRLALGTITKISEHLSKKGWEVEAPIPGFAQWGSKQILVNVKARQVLSDAPGRGHWWQRLFPSQSSPLAGHETQLHLQFERLGKETPSCRIVMEEHVVPATDRHVEMRPRMVCDGD